MGKFQPRQKAGIKFMGGESKSPTNTETGHAVNRKEIDANYPRDASTHNKKFTSAWPRMDLI